MKSPWVVLVVFCVGVSVVVALLQLKHTGNVNTGSFVRQHTISMDATSTLKLSIPGFHEDASIPQQYTCDGAGGSPEIQISGVPSSTVSLALIVDDPDVPKEVKADGVFDHWILYNIEPSVQVIPEGSSVGEIGLNGAGKQGYYPPCPPKQYQPSRHRYVFTLYALDTKLSFQSPPDKQQLLQAMEGHVLGQASYVGTYERP